MILGKKGTAHLFPKAYGRRLCARRRRRGKKEVVERLAEGQTRSGGTSLKSRKNPASQRLGEKKGVRLAGKKRHSKSPTAWGKEKRDRRADKKKRG